MSDWEQLTLWPEEVPKPVVCDFCKIPITFYYVTNSPPTVPICLGVIDTADRRLKCMTCLKNENISSEVEK